jgi:hypothetical protein
VLNIRPWETELLTVAEFMGLCDYLDRREARLKQATA